MAMIDFDRQLYVNVNGNKLFITNYAYFGLVDDWVGFGKKIKVEAKKNGLTDKGFKLSALIPIDYLVMIWRIYQGIILSYGDFIHSLKRGLIVTLQEIVLTANKNRKPKKKKACKVKK